MKDVLQRLSMHVLLCTSPVPFFLGDMEGTIVLTNEAFQQRFDQQATEHIRRKWVELARKARDVPGYVHNEMLGVESAGTKVWSEMHCVEFTWPEFKERLCAVFLIHQDTVYAMLGQFQHQVLLDALTGLPNRTLGLDRLQKALACLQRSPDNGFCLVYLDLVGFKQINDCWGHGVGDAILKAVADRMNCTVRQSDTVCRWGGDEFVLILEEIQDLSHAQMLMERIIQKFAHPCMVQDMEIQVGASAGGVFILDPKVKESKLLEKADQAMYRAKAKGPNSYCLVQQQQTPFWPKTDGSREIGRAIDKGEFFFAYQPIVNLQTGVLTGAEALLRWKHPFRGVLYPPDFLPYVEQTDMAGPLGEWIVAQTCGTLSQWRDRLGIDSSLGMHINMSKSQFMGGRVVQSIEAILRDTGIAPGCIYLDCLKASFLSDKKQAALASDVCHELGVNLVLDDLKINLFNLNFFFDFHCVPFRLVKVNGYVVDALRQENATIIQSIRTFINVLSGMGVQMAVKGIESREQLRAVKNLKCHIGQGYYFARPLPREEFERQWIPGQGHCRRAQVWGASTPSSD